MQAIAGTVQGCNTPTSTLTKVLQWHLLSTWQEVCPAATLSAEQPNILNIAVKVLQAPGGSVDAGANNHSV